MTDDDAARAVAQEGLRHIEDAVLTLLDHILLVWATRRLRTCWACALPSATVIGTT